MNDQIKAQPGLAAGKASPPALENVRIGIIGLGYVGLPLAVYMARHFPVTGFDVNKARVDELAAGRDRTGEVTDEEFEAARGMSYSA
ncbi:MAG: NAD(P)-binding domain-containing protein, partial [Methyloceanibacter sp.]